MEGVGAQEVLSVMGVRRHQLRVAVAMSPAVGFAGSRNRRKFSKSWDTSRPLAESWAAARTIWSNPYDHATVGADWPGINTEGGA